MRQRVHGRQQVQLVARIQAGGGFVQHQHAVFIVPLTCQQQLVQHAGQVHTLLFAARKAAVAALVQVLHIGQGQHVLQDALIFGDRGLGRIAAVGTRRPCPRVSCMRIGPHTDDGGHRQVKLQRRTLRQHGSAAGQFCRMPGRQRASVQRDAAGTGGQFARQRSQQRGFTGTISTQHADDLTSRQGQIDVGKDLTFTALHGDAMGLQHQRASRWMSTNSTGAPSKEVTIPMGNSAGITTMRATQSARTRMSAPASSDRGNSGR